MKLIIAPISCIQAGLLLHCFVTIRYFLKRCNCFSIFVPTVLAVLLSKPFARVCTMNSTPMPLPSLREWSSHFRMETSIACRNGEFAQQYRGHAYTHVLSITLCNWHIFSNSSECHIVALDNVLRPYLAWLEYLKVKSLPNISQRNDRHIMSSEYLFSEITCFFVYCAAC
jgi:hypothetical protein